MNSETGTLFTDISADGRKIKRGKKSWIFSVKGKENGRAGKRIRPPEALTARASGQPFRVRKPALTVAKKSKDGNGISLLTPPDFILSVIVTPANEGERDGLKRLPGDYFSKEINRLRKIWVDGGYSGSSVYEWVKNFKKTWRIDLELSEKEVKGFNVVKKRWAVERTFAWIFNFRRNSKDYETLTKNSEAVIQISMISILLRRLA